MELLTLVVEVDRDTNKIVNFCWRMREAFADSARHYAETNTFDAFTKAHVLLIDGSKEYEHLEVGESFSEFAIEMAQKQQIIYDGAACTYYPATTPKTQEEPFLLKQQPLEEEYEEVN